MTKARPFLLPAYLLLCLLLGGASNGGFLANLLLQIVAVILLAISFWNEQDQALSRAERRFAWLLVGWGLLAVLQFLPLPQNLWDMSGMRAAIHDQSASAGSEPWPVFVGLLPHEALKSAVWVFPAFALGIAMLRQRDWRAEHFAWAIQVAMVLSVAVSAVQLAGGQSSPAYFYDITNRGSTVGFFANSNHLATLLLVSLPFLAALIRHSENYPEQQRAAMLGVGGALFLVALVGIFVNGSLAGYGLVLPVLAASLLILFPGKRSRRLSLIILPMVMLGGVGLILATQEGAAMLAGSSTLAPAARETIFATSWQALGDFLPLGSGLGSFAEVYHLYEDPALVEQAYVNHAHNDYLEVLLEMGVPGALLLGAFLLWWLRRAISIWIAPTVTPFTTAAVVASATILVHSIVDYPLRTAAISSVFILSCALMTKWISGDGFALPHKRKHKVDQPG